MSGEYTTIEYDKSSYVNDLHQAVAMFTGPDHRTDSRAFAAMKNGEVPEKYARLVDAAYGLAQGTDWNKGNHAIMHGFRAKLILAIDTIKPIADRSAVKSALEAVEGKR